MCSEYFINSSEKYQPRIIYLHLFGICIILSILAIEKRRENPDKILKLFTKRKPK